MKTSDIELLWLDKWKKAQIPQCQLKERAQYGEASSNMLIKGDNLAVLSNLEQEYTGKVKCIYIDPPYNTKQNFDHYKDSLEHSSWLTMMRDRLVIMHRLLRDDGSIWISIDDSECHYLKVMCDEIFGRKNFIANVIWEKKYGRQNNTKYLSKSHDHILVYAKFKDQKPGDKKVKKGLNLLHRNEEMNAKYKNPDNDPRGPWKSGDLSVGPIVKEKVYHITTPSGRIVNPPSGRCWRVSCEKYQELVADNRIWFGKDGNNVPSLKRFLSEVQDGVVAKTIWKRDEISDLEESQRSFNLLPRNEEMNARYKNPDNDPRGPWIADNLTVGMSKEQRPNQYYAIVDPVTGNEFLPDPRRVWSYIPDTMDRLIQEERIIFPKDSSKRPSLKRFLHELQNGLASTTIWKRDEVGDNSEAKKEIIALNSKDIFSTPKPERLLQRIIHIASNPGDIVLDCFAGSGTTGAVAHKMGRQWIMVELWEHCHTHIIPRMKKVISGEDQKGLSKELNWQGGGGFKFFESNSF